MSNMVGCPADTCEFDGSIPVVADHLAESDDEGHTWEALGYEDTDGFRHETRLEEGQRLQEVAQEARDHGKFDLAIEELEGALHHFQRAKSFANDASSIENSCREVLRTIDEIETAEQGQVIDDLVDQAENAIDAGDKAHLEGNTDLAGQKYKEAIDALEEAKTLATELTPNRVSGIDRHLCRVQVRQQSLELSEVHQPIRELVADARDHAAAGDRAFQKSEYDAALNEYKKAREQYESLADSLEQFSFDESIADPKMCDVCRQRFDGELDSWRIHLGISLQVCPACTRFGSDGNLPSPREIATEHRTVVENIERIRDGDVEEINNQIKNTVTEHGFIPLAMPLIRETADEIDQLREDGVIPSELSDEFLNSLLEAEQCICGRELEPETAPYSQVSSLRGEVASDGVEQGAMRIVGHLRQFSDGHAAFFDEVDALIERRQEKHDEIDELVELIDEISTELQGLEGTTPEGESISDLEAKRERKEEEKDQLIADKGGIDEKISTREEEIEQLEDDISDQRDEREETRLAQRRQQAAVQVQAELTSTFETLKNRVRNWSNEVVNQTFSEIASKELEAEITNDFELKIWQSVRDDRVEVDKSTGERQIASLAFVGSLVKIAKKRYKDESSTEYFTGGIYPLVMDSPFGALDQDHRCEVSRILPELATQVVVFATDSQWEGPVEEEMRDIAGKQYWLDFSEGDREDSSPQTQIKAEQTATAGD